MGGAEVERVFKGEAEAEGEGVRVSVGFPDLLLEGDGVGLGVELADARNKVGVPIGEEDCAGRAEVPLVSVDREEPVGVLEGVRVGGVVRVEEGLAEVDPVARSVAWALSIALDVRVGRGDLEVEEDPVGEGDFLEEGVKGGVGSCVAPPVRVL